MAEKYLAKLERQWEQKSKRRSARELQMCSSARLDLNPSVPSPCAGLISPTNCIRLAVLTKDTRFKMLLFALFEHGIIDDNFNFLRWEAPDVVRGAKTD